MNKKELITPFLLVGLGLIFTIVAFAVFLSRGKSKKWVARKMKIGGILLTITAAACNGGSEVKCYDVAETNAMWINNTSNNGIELKLDTGNVLQGTISSLQGKDFSFLVSDSMGTKYQKGRFLLDSLTNYTENFKIELDKSLKPGKYRLKLYATSPDGQDTLQAKREFNLIIDQE